MTMKRIIGMLLALTLLAGIMPAGALAQEPEQTEPPVTTENQLQPTEEPIPTEETTPETTEPTEVTEVIGETETAEAAAAVDTYAYTDGVAWEQGTILAASGLEKDYSIVIRTVDYLRISDYIGMTLNADHYITYFVYDAEYNYLGNGKADLTANFLLSGQGISTHEMRIRYPEGEYFRIALYRGRDNEMTPDMLEGAGVKFLDSSHDPVFWEMGSIYAASGIAFVREQVIRSVNYLPAEDYAAVTIADGYAISFLAYDENLNYLGNGNPAKTGYFIPEKVTMQEIVQQYPDTKYIRLLLVEDPVADFTMEAVETSQIRIYRTDEITPEICDHIYVDGNCTICGCCIDKLAWEQGTIRSADGVPYYRTNVIRTANYLSLADYSGVTIDPGYTFLYFVYDSRFHYLGNGSADKTAQWLGSGVSFKTDAAMNLYPDGVYFRLLIKKDAGTDISVAAAVESHAAFYFANESVPERVTQMETDRYMSIVRCQDGAVFNNNAFIFNNAGFCTVYSLSEKTKIATFTLDKADILSPHANAVFFGCTYYAEDDTYPLLYVNIYNNYWTTNDRKEGICCVYRLTEQNGKFSTKLVQVLQIGFVNDLTLWKSMEGTGDYLPYGNFVVDTDNHKLYAFVLRDATRTTRFFKFDLPELSKGVYNETYGCNVVTLASSDIEDMFDAEHFEVIQGCSYYNGKILALQGLGTGTYAEPALRVIDLATKSVENTHWFADVNVNSEPEMIYVDHNSGVIYYAAIDGVLRTLKIPEIHIHAYENGICTGCGEEHAHAYGFWYTVTEATSAQQGREQRDCQGCDHSQLRKLIPVGLAAAVEPGKVTVGTEADAVKIGLSARLAIGGNPITDLELEYVITDESGKEITLEQALQTPGKYTITPKRKTP